MDCVGIGQRIRLIRSSISLYKFALMIGIHRESLIKYESEASYPDALTITTICDKFNINVSWLIFGKGYHHKGRIPIAGTVVTDMDPTSKTFMKTRVLYIDSKFTIRLEHAINEDYGSIAQFEFLDFPNYTKLHSFSIVQPTEPTECPAVKDLIEKYKVGEIPTAHEIQCIYSQVKIDPVWIAEGYKVSSTHFLI